MVSLRKLSHLVALAEERNFARAAQRVHLSQPAFSRSIQEIERETGMHLFDRTAGGVQPTPAGEFLIERGRRLLLDARTLAHEVEQFKGGGLGDTSFGIGGFAAAHLLPAVVPVFRKRHPEVNLRIKVQSWSNSLDDLQGEKIEFFVTALSNIAATGGLDFYPLGSKELLFFARAGHPLAGTAASVQELWRYGVATPQLPASLANELARLLNLPRGSLPNLALECDDLTALKISALATDTILASPAHLLQAEIASGALVQLEVDALPPLRYEWGAVNQQQRTLPPSARRLIAYFEQALNPASVLGRAA